MLLNIAISADCPPIIILHVIIMKMYHLILDSARTAMNSPLTIRKTSMMHNPNIVVFVEEVEEAKEIDVVDAVVETEVVVVKMIILTYLSLRYKSRRKRQTTALIMSFSPNNDENDESEDSGDNDTGDAFGCK